MTSLAIGPHAVGADNPPFIIAEIAQTHEGSLGTAFAYAALAKECGAHAIKFQTHIAAEESTPAEPWRVKFSPQDQTRYEYWQRMEFTFEQWQALKQHCDDLGIVFLSSPFSLEACRWLEALDMPAWKIASGEVANDELLGFVKATGRPVLLSSGFATPEDSIGRVQALIDDGVPAGVFHCTTRYPTPPEDVGLNILTQLQAGLPGVPVGLSDHSGTPTSGIVAAYLGAAMIEVHFTMHRGAFGPDVVSSLDPDGLRALVKGAHEAWVMRTRPLDKAQQLAGMGDLARIFARSLCARRAIAEGDTIGADDLAYKKPGGGMPYSERHLLIGRKARRALNRDDMLQVDDVQ